MDSKIFVFSISIIVSTLAVISDHSLISGVSNDTKLALTWLLYFGATNLLIFIAYYITMLFFAFIHVVPDMFSMMKYEVKTNGYKMLLKRNLLYVAPIIIGLSATILLLSSVFQEDRDQNDGMVKEIIQLEKELKQLNLN
ncbi:MAG: hypothetical protein WCW84_13190 [Sulfurimonas sp.]|jgi:hypothetical protein